MNNTWPVNLTVIHCHSYDHNSYKNYYIQCCFLGTRCRTILQLYIKLQVEDFGPQIPTVLPPSMPSLGGKYFNSDIDRPHRKLWTVQNWHCAVAEVHFWVTRTYSTFLRELCQCILLYVIPSAKWYILYPNNIWSCMTTSVVLFHHICSQTIVKPTWQHQHRTSAIPLIWGETCCWVVKIHESITGVTWWFHPIVSQTVLSFSCEELA